MKRMLSAKAGLAVFAPAQTIAGHYVFRGIREAASDLILRPDGRFEFVFIYGSADFWGAGKWTVTGSSVELRSEGAAAEGFELKKSAKVDFPGLKISVVGANGCAAANIDMAIETTTGMKMACTDNEGVAWVEVDQGWKAVHFEDRIYGFEADPIVLASDKNDFVFDFDDKGIKEMRFDGDSLAIRPDALEMQKFDPTQPAVYWRK